jgi:hypothetical protein
MAVRVFAGNTADPVALPFAPRAGAPSAEVLDFVSSLVAHGQVAFDSPPQRRGAVASYGDSGAATHAIRRRGRKQELQRIRFACNGDVTG